MAGQLPEPFLRQPFASGLFRAQPELMFPVGDLHQDMAVGVGVELLLRAAAGDERAFIDDQLDRGQSLLVNWIFPVTNTHRAFGILILIATSAARTDRPRDRKNRCMTAAAAT